MYQLFCTLSRIPGLLRERLYKQFYIAMTRKIFRRRQIICMRGLEYTISGFGKFLIVIAVSILGISLYRKI